MSSIHSSPSPRQGPTAQPSTQVDESQLPAGKCRYILLLPEIKGQRCACVNFTHNKAMPSATCDCGHLACYHNKTTELTGDGHEMELLKKTMKALEDQQRKMDQLEQEVQILHQQLGREQDVIVRVSELEEVVEKSKDEISQDLKASYRNLNRAWYSIGDLERQVRQHDEHFHHVDGRLRDVEEEQQRLAQRQLELVDENIALEERLDGLEESENDSPLRGRPRRKSMSDSESTPPGNSSIVHFRRPRSSEGRIVQQAPASVPAPMVMPYRSGLNSDPLWTVHISFLPSLSQPFPFERNTVAYKRCLSRGLHQMVPINGFDHEAFVSAVSRAFGQLLNGRQWMPLQALPCTAEQLVGLPMLRQLEPGLADCRYDVDFLREHCAVCDATGKIDHLYIAMRHDSLSWHFLKRAPVYLDGLEASWSHDSLLDVNDPFEDDDDEEMTRPSAGDIVQPSLKRAASEMSRSSSFGSTTTVIEGEASRSKRTCPLPNIVELRRRAERV